MAKEMYCLRVERAQKAEWDAYAGALGVDTSVMVREIVSTAVSMTIDQFTSFYNVPVPDESES